MPVPVEEKYPFYSALSPDARRIAEHRFDVETPRLAHQRARFRGEVPRARIIEIPGGRHYIFLTHPREVARAMRDFVR